MNNVFTLESDHGLGLRSAGGGDSGQKQGLEWPAETPTRGVTSLGLKPPLEVRKPASNPTLMALQHAGYLPASSRLLHSCLKLNEVTEYF